MTIRSIVAALTVALLLAPAVASAQAEKLSGRFTPIVESELRAIVDSARAAGLPTEPLVQRALEGASRGVDPARVVTAVRGLKSRLAIARRVLGPSDDAELVAAASALYLGVSPDSLARLSRSRGRSLATPLVVLSDMINQGVPKDTATRVIMALTAAGVNDEGYRALRQSVLLDIKSGVPPSAAASMRARGTLLEQRRPPSAARPFEGRPE
jgi:hypothetical protein